MCHFLSVIYGVFMEDQSAETCSGQKLLTTEPQDSRLDIIDGVLIAWLTSVNEGCPWCQIRHVAHWNVNLCWCDLCPSGLCIVWMWILYGMYKILYDGNQAESFLYWQFKERCRPNMLVLLYLSFNWCGALWFLIKLISLSARSTE